MILQGYETELMKVTIGLLQSVPSTLSMMFVQFFHSGWLREDVT